MKQVVTQFVRFGLVGFLAFVIDFGVFTVLTKLLAADPVLATALSFSVSVVFNYFASMRFVFQRKEDMGRAKEFTIFVVLAIIGLALNVAGMWMGDRVMGEDVFATKIVVTALVMVFNFVSRKVFLEGGGPSPKV